MATGKHFKPEASRPSQPLPVIPATQARGSRTAGGRHSAAQPGSRAPRRYAMVKPLVMAALVLAVVGVAVSGVIAWLSTTSSVSNTFELGTVNPTVQETFEDPYTEKKDVKISNDGNVPIYVRAQVNIYWVDAEGNQLWEAPVAGEDYTITWGDDQKWAKGSDGFYYWTEPLKAGETTGLLIDKLTWTSANSSSGRTLVCDIAVQGIQAEPAEAVQEAWGVTITEGAVTPVTTTEGAGE